MLPWKVNIGSPSNGGSANDLKHCSNHQGRSVILVLKFILVSVFVSFLLNHFNFYIISVFHEQSFQFLCSVDNIINLIRYVQESQQSPVYKNQNTNPVSFSKYDSVSSKQTSQANCSFCYAGLTWASHKHRKSALHRLEMQVMTTSAVHVERPNELRILVLLLCPEVQCIYRRCCSNTDSTDVGFEQSCLATSEN